MIDDEPQVFTLYERYLQELGYQVIGHFDPASAKERAKQVKPFAITLDIIMPGIDGWQVLNELKSDEETKGIPVIICSNVDDGEKAFNLGAADYIVKPILKDDLISSVNRLNTDESIREVLVIDDDSKDLKLIGKILSEGGMYKPILAKGGLEGWDMIISKPPNAIVLDLFMPEMDGFAILENLRTNNLQDIPVIVISGNELTLEQQSKLMDFGHRLLQIDTLEEGDLLKALGNVLNQVKN